MEPLRERIARLYQDWYGVTVSPERIVVTSGSSAAFVLAFLALFDAGARVALPAPGYPCYRHILTALGAAPVTIETGPKRAGCRRAEQIEEADAAAGARRPADREPRQSDRDMLEPERLAAIVDALPAARHLVHLGRDLPWPDLWRARGDGAAVLRRCHRHQQLLEILLDDRLAGRLDGACRRAWCAPSSGWRRTSTSRRRPSPRWRRSAPSTAWTSWPPTSASTWPIAICCWPSCRRPASRKIVPADGAFYLYVDVGHLTDDSLAFARLMLEETGIAATPGVDFDEARGRRFCGSPTRVQPARWPRRRIV